MLLQNVGKLLPTLSLRLDVVFQDGESTFIISDGNVPYGSPLSINFSKAGFFESLDSLFSDFYDGL